MSKPTALITGASGGIGLEIARKLADRGINLVLSARSEDKLNSLAKELSQKGIRCDVITADLGSPEGAQTLFDQVKARGIPVDILVNNAGFGLFGPFSESDLSRELEMIQVNVTSLTALTKLFLKEMRAEKSGRILNVASTASFQPGPLMAVYYATKSYVLSFSEALAEELEGTGISVTTLCPGATISGFQSAAKLDRSKLFVGKKLPSSAEVAETGVRAMLDGRRVVVHGLLNRILVQSVRFTPRRLITKIVRKVQEEAR